MDRSPMRDGIYALGAASLAPALLGVPCLASQQEGQLAV